MWRLKLLKYMFVLWTILILYWLFSYQIVRKEAPKVKAISKITIPAKRGEIFDRYGRGFALNVPGLIVYQISNKIEPFEPLAKWIGDSAIKPLPEGTFALLLAYDLPMQAYNDLKGVKGIRIDKFWSRDYPYDYASLSLIGRVDRNGNGTRGVESSLNDLLSGKSGYMHVYRTADGKLMFSTDLPHEEPQDGMNFYLTIDADIQDFAYDQLKKWVVKHGAKHGLVIVADPMTGEILAIVNYPPSDLKDYAVKDPYEPGSTFKIVTYTYAYENGVIDPMDSVSTGNGYLEIQNHKIRDVHPMGKITWKDALVHSSNVATSKLALSIGKYRIAREALKFGFGTYSGILLPAESFTSAPNMHVSLWDSVTFAGFAIGQGVLVNGVQMVMAYSALANGGYLLVPKLIKAYESDGELVRTPDRIVIRKVMKRKTAELLTDILTQVVDSGTGRLARIKGVKIAGKTGTAQKFDKKTGRYSTNRVTSSFIGFFPAEAPRYLVYVVIDEPKGVNYGGYVAAPLFRRIALFLLNRNRFRSW